MKVQSFLGSEPSNGLGSLSLGLDVEVWDWTSLSMVLMNLSAFWFILSHGCVQSIVRCFVEVGRERFRLYGWVCGLVCSQHGYRSGWMWQSLSSWARVPGK